MREFLLLSKPTECVDVDGYSIYAELEYLCAQLEKFVSGQTGKATLLLLNHL